MFRIKTLLIQFKKGRLPIIGLFIIIIMIIIAISADIIAPYDPYEINLKERLYPPSRDHLLGQDDLGRDVLSRLIYGSRISIKVGIFVIIISVFIGTSLDHCINPSKVLYEVKRVLKKMAESLSGIVCILMILLKNMKKAETLCLMNIIAGYGA